MCPRLSVLGNAEVRRVQAQIHQAAQEEGLCSLSLQGPCRGRLLFQQCSCKCQGAT